MDEIKFALFPLYHTVPKNKEKCIQIFDRMLQAIIAQQNSTNLKDLLYCMNLLLLSCREIQNIFQTASGCSLHEFVNWKEWDYFTNLVADYTINKLEYCRTCRTTENLYFCEKCERYYCSIDCQKNDVSRNKCNCENLIK